MNVLFILEDGACTTFYLYLLKDRKKKLLRFAPEVRYPAGETLGQVYARLTLEEFLSFFGTATQLSIDHFVVADKGQVIDFLFKSNHEQTINNPEPFTHLATGQRFEKGKQRVARQQLDQFISYQRDGDMQFGIFERQEHVLRLIKNELLSDKRLTALPKKFNELNKNVQTNMKLPTLLKFFKAYKETEKGKTQRFSAPPKTDPQNIEWPAAQLADFIKG